MKTALYLRCSTNERQQDVDSQRLALEAWASSQGHEITKVYADYDSGTKRDREKFDLMLKDTHRPNRGWQLLAFYDLSRLTREGPLQTLQYLGALKDRGIHFHSLQEPFLTSMGPFADAIIALIGTVNKLYTDTLRQKVKDGLANARSKGVVLGRPQKVDEAKVRQLLYEGLTAAQVAEQLDCSVSSVKRIKYMKKTK